MAGGDVPNSCFALPDSKKRTDLIQCLLAIVCVHLEDVARGVYAAGLDVDEFFRRACSVTNEWEYRPDIMGHADRIQQRGFTTKSVPLRWRTLAENLDPQPRASAVIKDLLSYIDRCDAASTVDGAPKPPFCTEDGRPIFPEGEKWWLTELSIRKEEQAAAVGDEDGPPSDVEEEHQGEDSDVIDPELPIEEDESSGDERGVTADAAGGEPLQVKTGHDAQVLGCKMFDTNFGLDAHARA